MATGNALNNNIANCTGLPVTGLSLATNSAMIVTDNSGVASMTTSMTNGQVVVGSTGATPAAAALTAGSGISITNGAGSITIAATGGGGGGMVWNNVTADTQAMAVGQGYVVNNPSNLVIFDLPATANVGDIVAVQGSSVNGWGILLSGSQVIHFSQKSSTVGTGGALGSLNRFDTLYLMCVVADTEWAYNSGFGNFNIF